MLGPLAGPDGYALSRTKDAYRFCCIWQHTLVCQSERKWSLVQSLADSGGPGLGGSRSRVDSGNHRARAAGEEATVSQKATVRQVEVRRRMSDLCGTGYSISQNRRES